MDQPAAIPNPPNPSISPNPPPSRPPSKLPVILIPALLALVVILTAAVFLVSSKKSKPAAPPAPTPKTWEVILSYDPSTQNLTVKKLSLMKKEINQDFRMAQLSPYELVVLDKSERALFRSKISITEQILDLNEIKPASASATINTLDTILYIPFQTTGAKIIVNKNFSPILQVNIPPLVSFNLIPEVHAQTPQRSGPLQVVFVGDGYTNITEFRQDVTYIENEFNQTPPYAGTNIFDFKTFDNQINTGCRSAGLQVCFF